MRGLIIWISFLCITHVVPACAVEPVDKVYVSKSKRTLSLMHKGKIIKQYRISLGGHPLGHKQQQGDSRTPEGSYVIDYRNPQSQFHLSLHISYPDKEDRKQAAGKGVSPGGDIFIHGLPNGVNDGSTFLLNMDWTDGCIAVSNRAILEIWKRVRNGTPIEIAP